MRVMLAVTMVASLLTLAIVAWFAWRTYEAESCAKMEADYTRFAIGSTTMREAGVSQETIDKLMEGMATDLAERCR